jgi:hypothetical protein
VRNASSRERKGNYLVPNSRLGCNISSWYESMKNSVSKQYLKMLSPPMSFVETSTFYFSVLEQLSRHYQFSKSLYWCALEQTRQSLSEGPLHQPELQSL